MRRHAWRVPAHTVCQLVRQKQSAFSAHAHAVKTQFKSRDHLPPPRDELKGILGVCHGAELFAVAQPSRVHQSVALIRRSGERAGALPHVDEMNLWALLNVTLDRGHRSGQTRIKILAKQPCPQQKPASESKHRSIVWQLSTPKANRLRWVSVRLSMKLASGNPITNTGA